MLRTIYMAFFCSPEDPESSGIIYTDGVDIVDGLRNAERIARDREPELGFKIEINTITSELDDQDREQALSVLSEKDRDRYRPSRLVKKPPEEMN